MPSSEDPRNDHQPYTNPALPVEDRVQDLLARMTLAEKVGQMLQLDARGNLTELVQSQLVGSLLHASPKRMLQARQLVLQTRLQIPLLMADDCIHGHSFWPGATIFPTQLAMAATWDPELLERGARAAALEIASTGLHWTFSPVLCIARDLRWGRVGETFGEDPVLIGELGAAMIRGYQGDGSGDRTSVMATAKHFAGYSETQGGRDASEADLSQRKLRAWFLPPFQRAVEAGCKTFMLGYQAIDGVPITANRWLLNDVLKGEWGFRGTLITDWDNVGRMVWEQRVCADDIEAAVLAVNAGNDLVMNTPQFFDAAQAAVAQGRLSEQPIDDAVRRILRLKFELGLFEDPRNPDPDLQKVVVGAPQHRAINEEMARRCLVLLHNQGLLPLQGGLTRGTPDARRAAPRGGLQSSARWLTIHTPNSATGPERQAKSTGWTKGIPGADLNRPRRHSRTRTCGLDHQPSPRRRHRSTDPGPCWPDLPRWATSPPALRAGANRSIDAGRRARGRGRFGRRHRGRGRHSRPHRRRALNRDPRTAGRPDRVARRALQVGDAIRGSPHPVETLNTAHIGAQRRGDHSSLQSGHAGGSRGRRLLFGLIEPTGRLPISVARHAGQLPVFYNQVRGQHGDRYADLTQEPQYAFGYGLSYTTVEYSNLQLAGTDLASDETLHGTVTLTNTGSRPSLETVQVYVSDLVTTVTWAERELKTFTQVLVPPHTSIDAEFALPIADCSIVDAEGRRVVEPGDFKILVGSSSRLSDLLDAQFTVLRAPKK